MIFESRNSNARMTKLWTRSNYRSHVLTCLGFGSFCKQWICERTHLKIRHSPVVLWQWFCWKRIRDRNRKEDLWRTFDEACSNHRLFSRFVLVILFCIKTQLIRWWIPFQLDNWYSFQRLFPLTRSFTKQYIFTLNRQGQGTKISSAFSQKISFSINFSSFLHVLASTHFLILSKSF
jgi:hypothetical protein